MSCLDSQTPKNGVFPRLDHLRITGVKDDGWKHRGEMNKQEGRKQGRGFTTGVQLNDAIKRFHHSPFCFSSLNFISITVSNIEMCGRNVCPVQPCSKQELICCCCFWFFNQNHFHNSLPVSMKIKLYFLYVYLLAKIVLNKLD